jgi:hypothetical protein
MCLQYPGNISTSMDAMSSKDGQEASTSMRSCWSCLSSLSRRPSLSKPWNIPFRGIYENPKVAPWEGTQSAGDPPAARAGYPDAKAHGHHPPSSNLGGRRQTSAAAPVGRRYGGPQHASAPRRADTDHNPRDPSARIGDRTGECRRVSAPVVGGGVVQGVPRGGRLGPAAGPHPGRPTGTLRGRWRSWRLCSC